MKLRRKLRTTEGIHSHRR